jgi:hypothetical protein
MVEFSNHYTHFLKTVTEHGKDIVLQAIMVDHNIHPVASEVTAVLIRDTATKTNHHFSWKHGDAVTNVTKERFCQDLSALPNRKWVFDKKSFVQALPISRLLDVNLYRLLDSGMLIDQSKFETLAHRIIYRTLSDTKGLNNVVPILKHQEMFDAMCEDFHPGELDEGYLKENDIIIETLAQLESNGIHVTEECFRKHFAANIPRPNTVFSQYNIYTATGRPSNHFGNVNYAALNKDNGVRKCFTSRFGKDGKMVLIDYSAFHPRIICHLIKFPLSIDVDIYKYLGEIYFGRKELGDYELNETKKLTFRQLYGGVEEQFEHIKYFAKLKSFIDENWKEFQKTGRVLTPVFKRKITDKHVLDPNPSKLFNYILQATETEIAIPALEAVNGYLLTKKSKAVLYTYDSILFDFHKDDGSAVLNDVMTIMKMGERFPIKVYLGESYDSVSQIYP